MVFTLHKRVKQGGATLLSLAISTAVLAQAPVYDVNSSNNNASGSGNNGSLEQRIVVLERIVASRTEMQHRLQQQLDMMQGDIDELRGAVEVHTNQLEKVLERQRELYLEIDKRVEALKQSGFSAGSATSSSTGASDDTPENEPEITAGSADESSAYDDAVNLILKSREYDKAIPAFQSFIKRFPNSQYAPNAHYWLGQLLFNKQQWDKAAEQFNIVSNKFSSSTKRPDALLKLGVIEERKGNNAKAKQYLQEVVSKYPNSSARKLAESRLSGL
ncbi:tol-pal system protein YbgF [Alteromonas pelagimontana]|uniref:Cell division coordinator CpoB n=1 Tax=Alteromonas pelagimontana TaxID=1858656 RepID=A0A6M4MA24_9ALTE|nr:tol-pal system protein YbgF [Alteromonas pelagimontana]QJR79819.1 tol-pal system protein YbgF [Alteromonas pelagimontana]